jgi:hypothetical protein
MAARQGPSLGALVSLQMARERARMTGSKPASPFLLEWAAQQWKAHEEQRQMLPFERRGEPSVMALQRVPLKARADGRRTDGEIGWRPYQWGDEGRSRRAVLNASIVGRIAQRLRATEWARARGRKTPAPLGSDLEAWAQRWRRADGGS